MDAVTQWRMMENVGWAGIERESGGKAVVTFAKAYGGLVWVLNPCRSVYPSLVSVPLLAHVFPPGLLLMHHPPALSTCHLSS